MSRVNVPGRSTPETPSKTLKPGEEGGVDVKEAALPLGIKRDSNLKGAKATPRMVDPTVGIVLFAAVESNFTLYFRFSYLTSIAGTTGVSIISKSKAQNFSGELIIVLVQCNCPQIARAAGRPGLAGLQAGGLAPH